jgi:hypothetical protein
MSIGIKIAVDATRYGGLDADAAAFIALSGITNETQITAINNLYKDFKGQGANNTSFDFYTRLTAFWLFVGTTTANIKYNGKTPSESNTYNLAFSGTAPTINSNGCKFNGTNGFADTFVPQNIISNSANGMSVYFRENTARNEIQMGYLENVTTYKATEIGMGYTSGINTKFFGGNKFDQNFGATNYQLVGINGLIRLNRTTSNNYKVYRNGSETESLNATAFNNTDTKTIVIGGERKSSDGGVQTYSNKTFCFADMMTSNSLSAAEELVYYNCVQAFQTALSRNV